MNDRIRSHFDEIEARLIECPVILTYQIIRRDISPDDGKEPFQAVLAKRGPGRTRLGGCPRMPFSPKSSSCPKKLSSNLGVSNLFEVKTVYT